MGTINYPHPIIEETEAQISYITSPKTQSLSANTGI